MSDRDHTIALARRFLELVGAQDIDGILELITPTWTMIGGSPGLPAGEAGIRQFFATFGRIICSRDVKGAHPRKSSRAPSLGLTGGVTPSRSVEHFPAVRQLLGGRQYCRIDVGNRVRLSVGRLLLDGVDCGFQVILARRCQGGDGLRAFAVDVGQAGEPVDSGLRQIPSVGNAWRGRLLQDLNRGLRAERNVRVRIDHCLLGLRQGLPRRVRRRVLGQIADALAER